MDGVDHEGLPYYNHLTDSVDRFGQREQEHIHTEGGTHLQREAVDSERSHHTGAAQTVLDLRSHACIEEVEEVETVVLRE
jgi:hypothetical protein